MKYKRKIKSLAALLMACMAISSANVLPVSAGLVTSVVDTDSIGDEINGASWNNAQEDVYAEAGVIVFPEESTDGTKLITKGMAKAAEGVENLLTFKATLQFNSLPEGEKFILAFGLGSIDGESGEEGNIEIAFENKGGLTVSLMAYTADGEGTALLTSKKAGTLSNAVVEAVVTTDQRMSLKIGGNQIYKGDIPVKGEGRVGFIQTGACAVRVKDISISTFKYSRPENCDIYENFDSGEFNANLLTSRLVSSRKDAVKSPILGIDEVNGNNAFRFYKISTGYLSTVYDYSNFEMTFDVPYLRRNVELDEEGVPVETRSNDLIVAFGLQGHSFKNDAWTGAYEYLWFNPNNRVISKSGASAYTRDNYPFFDGADDKGFSIKICAIDGTVTVYLKWIEETTWTEALTYPLDTPTGTISIWAASGDYAIDNLKILNKDSNPELVEVEYKSNLIESPKDWEYEPMEKVYVERKATEDETGFSCYIALPIVGGICVAGLGIVAASRVLKNRKRMEGEKSEK